MNFYLSRLVCQKNWWLRMWWRYVPGVEIKVKWPKGEIVVDHNDSRWYDCGTVWVKLDSADPNDFYRTWLEQNVGRKGWDWDWTLADNDVAENRLTIKFRKKHAKQAIVACLQWT